ncbi:MAG: Asp23/Gls24 family envelope stress response protein [Christensenellaceae bacterium]|nr:Asp23/Gls24 family envelope stress response protein [Christensenellaceae bacterium]
MSAKKENLPLNIDTEIIKDGAISYASEVIATIAGVAASEVEGIASMGSTGSLSDILGRNRNLTKGVKVEVGSEEVSVDIYVIVEYGIPIHKAAQEVQLNVQKAIETMTGMHVVKVDVHVLGVNFEKENEELPSLDSSDLEYSSKTDKDNKESVELDEMPSKVEWELNEDDIVENNQEELEESDSN